MRLIRFLNVSPNIVLPRRKVNAEWSSLFRPPSPSPARPPAPPDASLRARRLSLTPATHTRSAPPPMLSWICSPGFVISISSRPLAGLLACSGSRCGEEIGKALGWVCFVSIRVFLGCVCAFGGGFLGFSPAFRASFAGFFLSFAGFFLSFTGFFLSL